MFRNQDRLPLVVKNLIIINCLMYVATIVLMFTQQINLESLLGLHNLKPVGEFHFYQVFTHMFMHATFGMDRVGGVHLIFPFHLLFNMFVLFNFGATMENYWGPKRFLVFYMICGLGAGLINLGIETWSGAVGGVMIGASGAIVGVVVAFAYLFPNTELIIFPLPIPIKAKYLIPLYLLYQLYSGLSPSIGDNSAHFAHLGGALVGFITVWVWQRDRTNFY